MKKKAGRKLREWELTAVSVGRDDYRQMTGELSIKELSDVFTGRDDYGLMRRL